MAPSFLHGILPLEVDKQLTVTILQLSCGLVKGTATITSETAGLWLENVQLESCHHDTITCTLKQERHKGCMHVLVVERVASKKLHASKECCQRVGHEGASSWFGQYQSPLPQWWLPG